MADEKLCAASHHQIERLLRRGAEVFASYGDHYIGVLGQKADKSLEAGDEAGRALQEEACRPAFRQT